jgi:hypothetical protein
MNKIRLLKELNKELKTELDIKNFEMLLDIFKVTKNMNTNLNSFQDIFVNDFSEISSKVYEREDFIIKHSRNKRVIHFGFLDSPFTLEKIASGDLLHKKLKKNAKSVYGIDIDENSLDLYRNQEKDIQNEIYDISRPKISFKSLPKSNDLIIFGEILEHLKNPGNALNNLHTISVEKKSEILITVPNAFSLGAFWASTFGYEIVHPEHYYYFSPLTIKKLLSDFGFKNIHVRMYANKELIDSKGKSSLPGITQSGLIVTCRA